MGKDTVPSPETPEGSMSRRGFLRVAGVAGLVSATASATALRIGQNNVLSPGLNSEVRDFAKKHPEWASEFMPFEQDCIAGIEREAQACEEAVRGQLADFRDEISLRNNKAQVNAREAQVNAREAQVNAREAQVNAREAQVNGERAQVKLHQEMIDNIKIVVGVLGINNILRGVRDGELGDTLSDLKKINNPQLRGDIDDVLKIGGILLNGGKIDKGQAEKMQSVLLSRSARALSIYQGLPPEEQKRFTSTYTMAVGAPKYAIKL